MWPWSRIRELTQMLEAEQALSTSLSEENAVLRENNERNGQMWLRAAHQNSDLRNALVKIKDMRTPKANGTVVRMAKVAGDALSDARGLPVR